MGTLARSGLGNTIATAISSGPFLIDLVLYGVKRGWRPLLQYDENACIGARAFVYATF